jgi:hypothetical protein
LKNQWVAILLGFGVYVAMLYPKPVFGQTPMYGSIQNVSATQTPSLSYASIDILVELSTVNLSYKKTVSHTIDFQNKKITIDLCYRLSPLPEFQEHTEHIKVNEYILGIYTIDVNLTIDAGLDCSLADSHSLEFEILELEPRIIYPNPCQSNLFISDAKNISAIQIFDSKGGQAKRIEAPVSYTIQMSDLPIGLYFMHIYYADTKVMHRIIKN